MADARAREAGVRPGLKSGGVLTLAPDTTMFERDLAREADAMMAVAVALMRFSPNAALCAEATVLLDVGASLRLFGGVGKLCREAAAVLRTLGFTARISAAPTGQGAWLLAQRGAKRLLKMSSLEKALASQPFTDVPEVQPFAQWFTGIGCATIADIRRLPRAGLQRRCGPHLLDSLDRAFGVAPEFYVWLQLPPTFSARVELPDRVTQADAIFFATQRLIAQMCGWLVASQLALTGARVMFEHERGRAAIPPTEIEITLAEPTWREAHLLRLLKERLDRTALAAAVLAVRLEANKVTQAVPASDALFPGPGGTAAEHRRLIELLVARLGAENVLTPAPTADHRPEIANRWVPIQHAPKPHPLPQALPRPTWLLENPVQLLMRENRPFYGSPLKMVSPSERIEGGWFDGHVVTRDYYVAQAKDQSCYWIYRERATSLSAEAPRWFLHGLFG